jgi:hypothetical protein
MAFTVIFFVVFVVSERLSRRRSHGVDRLEKFNVRHTSAIDPAEIGVRGKIRKLVPVRDPHNLQHLDRVLNEAQSPDVDVVVVTVKVERGLAANGAEPHFSSDEQAIFSAVVNRAEEHGKTVTQLVVTSNDMLFAIARAAKELGAREIILGRSAKYAPDVQLEMFAIRWGAVEPDGDREITVRVASATEDLRFAV